MRETVISRAACLSSHLCLFHLVGKFHYALCAWLLYAPQSVCLAAACITECALGCSMHHIVCAWLLHASQSMCLAKACTTECVLQENRESRRGNAELIRNHWTRIMSGSDAVCTQSQCMMSFCASMGVCTGRRIVFPLVQQGYAYAGMPFFWFCTGIFVQQCMLRCACSTGV